MTMQNNIDIIGWNIRRNMLQPKFQSITLKIDNQGPVFVPITVPAHNRDRRPKRLQITRNGRLADVAEMPDLIRLAREIENFLRQLVMRVGESKNSKNAGHLSLNKAGTREGKNHF